MANSKQAKKRAHQAEKRRRHNMAMRSRMRTHIKNVLKAVEAGDREAAASSYRAAVPVIDSLVSKGIVHKNKAARQKSRLNAKLKALPA